VDSLYDAAMATPLVGKELLEMVNLSGEIPKLDLARKCGYLSVGTDGSETIDLLGFFNAVLVAQGVDLDSLDDNDESEE